jgi:rod shape-determining protein MreC
MPRSAAPRSRVIVGIIVVLLVQGFFFGDRLTAWVANISGPFLSPVTRMFVRARTVVSIALGTDEAASQRMALEEQLVQLRAQLANQDELRQEVAFYKAASGIRDQTGAMPIRAGIFSYPQAGGVSQVVLNRGSDDSIAVGDVVVTSSGALVGVVSRVYARHAVVSRIGDAGLDVTVRIVGTDVSGLLRATPNGDVMIDLVQKNETVVEQSVVATSGDDWFPSGLIVGTVRSVDNDATTLFKIVRVSPTVPAGIAGDVVVIKR